MMKPRTSFWGLIWRAARTDLCLGLPWLPLYSCAELLLALSAAALLQLVFLTQSKIDLATLIPGKLRLYFPISEVFDKKELVFLIPFIIVFAAFIKLIAGFLSSYLTQRAGHRVAHAFREEMLRGFLSSSGNVLDRANPDTVANQMMQDTTLLQSAISKGTLNAIRDVLVLTGIVIAMLLISWQSFCVGIAVVLPIALSLRTISQKLSFYTKTGQQKQIGLSTRLLQTYHGSLTVHALRSADREKNDFASLNEDNYNFMKKSLFVRTFFPPATEFFGIILLALVFQFRFVSFSPDQAGIYTSLFILLAFSFRYIKNIAGMVTFFTDISVVIQRVRGHIQNYALVQEGQKPKALPASSPHAVVVSDVSYQLHDGTTILSSTSLTIPKGSKVAFIGESGAGKTTLLRILAGLIYPQSGQVQMTPEFLLASQMPYIFRGTIKENIIYCQKHIPEHLVEDRCKDVVLDLMLAYSNLGANLFLEKQVGFLGEGLSGGEKARVSLGRALLASPKLILLDEPTANLDAASARLFWEAVLRWKQQDPSEHTLVAVSHVLSEVADFDFCYVFEHGRIVKSGKPQDILKN